MAEEIGFENGRNSNFQGLVTLTLTLDPAIRHRAYRRASLIDLYLYTKFHWNRRNFLWTTDGRTDGHFPPLILLGRLLEVDLKSLKTQVLKPHFDQWLPTAMGISDECWTRLKLSTLPVCMRNIVPCIGWDEKLWKNSVTSSSSNCWQNLRAK